MISSGGSREGIRGSSEPPPRPQFLDSLRKMINLVSERGQIMINKRDQIISFSWVI